MKHNKKFGGKVKLKMKTHQELFAFNVCTLKYIVPLLFSTNHSICNIALNKFPIKSS